MAKRTPMMDQYLQIKQAYPDALLFFRLGDFYELFYDDAIEASGILQLTLTGRGTGDSRMPMCGVPYHAAEGYIGRLVAQGLKVAICEQMEDPKQAKTLVRRDVVRVVTPGTAFEFARDADARLLLATLSLREEGDWLAVALDAMTGESWERQGSASEVSGWLQAMRIAEVVYPPDAAPAVVALCESVVEQTRAVLTHAPGGMCADGVSGYPLLAAYVTYTGKRAVTHLQAPETITAERYVHLSATATAHLELLQPLTPGRKGATLLETLDHAGSVMGRRALRSWIERPLAQVGPIHERQEAIANFLTVPGFLQEVSEALKGMPDMARITSRLSFGTATPPDLLRLTTLLSRAQTLRSHLLTHATAPLVKTLSERIRDLQALSAHIETMLVTDPPVSVKDGGVIATGVDDEVDRLRELTTGGRAWIAALEQEERLKTGIRSLKIAYHRVFGYYIEVTSANAGLVPERYERKQTLAGAERFVTPELRARETEILHADERLRTREAELFAALLTHVAREVTVLQDIGLALGEIDALVSLAIAAQRYRYVQPVVDESRDIEIRLGRHPVVERANPGAYVPNDLRLLSKERSLALITGPNMAGKSTYMRQIALIVLMAQMGSFVPAEAARIGLVDKLFTRIGASDDVSAGLSTFMVEMTEMAEILREATERSFVILDEVGRGTATYDGMSIAQAVVEYMHDVTRARTLFATHYHELISLPARLPRCFNLSVAVAQNGEQIVFLHQIVERPADRSYGIQVARRAGLPYEVTERARIILDMLERRPRDPVYEQVAATLFEETPEPITIEHSADVDVYPDWIEELKTLSLDDLSPRHALAYLYDLQRRSKGETP
ncbi:MAG: DNA mismatch repair protein MutS [Firmicutes bacterium]|nr:DNA mismatch repair protein MutS [Bacillota bacterium]